MGKTYKEMDSQKAKKYRRIHSKQTQMFDQKHLYINSKEKKDGKK